MRGFRDLSLRSKLTAVILAITVACLGSGFGFVLVKDVRTFRHDMIESTSLIARVVGDACVGALAFADQAEAETALTTLRAIPNIQHAYLFDGHGQVFASYHAAGAAPAAVPAPDAPRELREAALHVSQPIEYRGLHYGSLHICASTAALDQKIAAHLTTTLAVMAAVILLGVLFALRLQGPITGPILSLADAARRISEGHDYSIRVEAGGRDEVGALCRGFNEMLAQMQRRELERDTADRRTREKSQFLANMSHELRTPLNSIIGFSEVLLMRLPDKVAAKELRFLQNINASGQHLLGIINDILDLSKVEAGKMDIHAAAVSVRGVIEGVCHVMRGVSNKRKIRIEVDAGADLPLLEVDPVKFKQVLYNLLSNAVKFSAYDGVVQVTARMLAASDSPLGRESIAVAVSDDGPGIDAKDHDVIFQEYGQADEGAAGQVEGTGLGLALVRRFVELHRGVVELRSARGQGSTFSVIFPRQLGSIVPVAADTPRANAGLERDILVVQEDPSAYERIAGPIARAHHRPVWARGAEEALRLARNHEPAAIALDLALPRHDGWELLRTLKADPATRHIPIVIVSLTHDQELAVALDASDYFLKPFDQEHLLRRLKTLMLPRLAAASRLLIVDDESNVHDLLEAWLSPQGYALEHARSGVEGIERALANPPDLVILDLLMNEVDGFQVAARLKAERRTAQIPILVFTSKDLSDDDRKRLQGRMTAAIRKGDTTEASLIAAIERALRVQPSASAPPS